jgi:preprotein translocase subunit SecA
MQIIGPDGTPIETAEQLAAVQMQAPAIVEQSVPKEPVALPAASQRPAVPIPTKQPSTTIDALEREFQKKKQKELDQARSAGAPSTNGHGSGPKRTGAKVGRNDKCPCGSGKKYKQCHGASEA